MVTAYLVLWLDLSGALPRVVEVTYAGEPRPTSLDLYRHYPTPLIEAKGASWEQARRALFETCRANPNFRWALPYVAA